ncbi:hypothetical protein LCGC14_1688240 [marine sediment metagenome]|uniref:Uncharacterized protein n=1 Tax=marine sediment metagenome TaxID=412755 RepID=A0A0F9K267_9ZZZZ
MRIVVETERETWRVGGCPVICVKVSVAGKEDISLSHTLAEAEMESHFDILWEYLGKKIKAHSKEKGVSNGKV